MWFRRHKHGPPGKPSHGDRADPVRIGDARAYGLLEEARLRCEKLRSEAATAAKRDALERLHRELGLAGFFASSNIPARARRGLLGQAHQRCAESVSECSNSIDALALIMLGSAHAVEHGLLAPGLSDHMHLAHVHLLRGQELLKHHASRTVDGDSQLRDRETTTNSYL